MKISTWSLVGYAAGFSFSLGSFVRYFILWPDLDRAIVYSLLGVMICAFAWLYNRQLEHSNKIEAMQDYLSESKFYKGGKANGEYQ